MVNEREKSEYHDTFSYLHRLNNLFYNADQAAINLNPHVWYHVLNVLFREVSPNMGDAEIKEMWEQSKEIKELLFNTTGYGNPSMGIDPELYEKLHEYELEIRKVVREAGLDLSYKDDPKNALM